MLISEPPIHVPPSLAGVFGFNEAAVIQTIHFWLTPNVSPHFIPYFKEGRYWVPDIFDHLYQKFYFWDEDTIAYMCAEFEQSGILMMLKVEDPLQSSGMIIYHTLSYEVLREKSGLKPVPTSSHVDENFVESILDMGATFDKESTFDSAANENINMPSFFTAKIHKRGAEVYVMEIQGVPHFLACELLLEIQDRTAKANDRPPVDIQPSVHLISNKTLKKEIGDESAPDGLPPKEVICHFPQINDLPLKEFIWGDAVLYEIVMVTFQMNALEHLFSFCKAHKASKLVIYADNDDELVIYKDFLAHKEKSKNLDFSGGKKGEEKGKKTEIAIPVDREILDVWAGFMKAITIKFRHALLDGKKTNLAIQNYLKIPPLPE